MADVEVLSGQAAALRRRAEELALARVTDLDDDIEACSPADLRRIFHELRVHQIELEMQNEELRRTQTLLDEARARYFDLYDLAPMGYLTLSEAGLIQEANLYVAERLGLPRKALVQQPFSRFILKEDQDSFYLHRRRLADTGSPESWDLRMVDQKGTEFWAHLAAATALGPDGSLMYRVTLGDISGRKQAEAEQRRLEAMLQQSQKMESLGSLASGIAHDMNNVLGAILGLASANLELQPEGSAAFRAFQVIVRAAERGGTTVRGLLSLARQRPAEEKALDLNLLLLDEIRLLERTTLNRVELKVELCEDLLPVFGDPAALSHVFMNLLVNAVDAMPQGGTIAIRSRNLGRHQIEVTVEDTGAGMTPEVMQKALDPYFSTKEVGKGTGLGLSIAYSTVTAHHGQLLLDSELGQGTRILVQLPALDYQCGAAESRSKSGMALARCPLAVLVVDDDELIRTSMETLLQTLGHRAELASSGAEALALLQAGLEVDGVILDLNMPGLDGAATLQRLRVFRPTLPVLIATGRADQHAMALLQRHPKVQLLAKPFSLDELAGHLGQLLAP